MKKTLLAALIVASALAPLAFAQHRDRDRDRDHRDRPHPAYRTPHVVFDNRFHHDHYYPRVGYAVTVLPAGHIALGFRGGGRYFFHAGVWYAPRPSGFVVVRPPVGIVVPVLPPAYTTVYVAGAPYYYANDVYYVAAPGGYEVAPPPAEAPVAQAPATPPPAPATWYYCESSKTYYPYANQCPEGWKQVPATPPR